MEVIADVVQNPAFSKMELDRLRPRVLNAITRINENWRSELSAYFQSRFYTSSPYRMLPIGTAEAIAKLDSKALEAFHRRLLTAQSSTLAIYGDIDAGKAEQLAKRLFAGLPGKASAARPVVAAEPPLEQPKLYIRSKSPDRTAAGVYIGFRGMMFANVEDRYPMAVLDTIISGYTYPAGWLHEALRGGNRDLVYEVHAMNVIGVEPGHFGAYAACQPDKVAEVYRIMMEQIDRARAGQFDETAFKRAKGVILTTDLMESQTNRDRAMQASLDELYGLGFDHRDSYSQRINAVTMDDVRRVAKKYLATPFVVIVTPQPQAVKIGIEPTAVEPDVATSAPAEQGTKP
jgi:zinc protease